MSDAIPEFARFGSTSLEDYVAGLRAELASGVSDTAAVKAELARVTGTKETAVASRLGQEKA